jgi:hypothetical protein
MKTRTIQVTQEDINKGLPRSYDSCPIALAANREFSDARHITVSPNKIIVHRPEESPYSLGETWYLPTKAILFILAFDNRGGSAVSPFTFEVTD